MKYNNLLLLGAVALGSALVSPSNSAPSPGSTDFIDSLNSSGTLRTVSSNGPIDQTGPFFQSLGSNGRKCVTCHQPAEDWTITPSGVQLRFLLSNCNDPLFRTNDGSNSPNADVSTFFSRLNAYSMLLTKGLIRVERPIPSGAEFDLIGVDDPYHYASASGLSLFRRPLPSTNLRFISTVMWDGREVDAANPMKIANDATTNRSILLASLAHQSLDATSGHAQGTLDLTTAQQRGIVDFEMGLATGQVSDFEAGSLTKAGAYGGPANILALPFYIGINDNVADPAGPFNSNSMSLYNGWEGSNDNARASVARGEQLFNTKPIVISGVKGINDNPYFGSPASFTGSCTTCHNTPNSGNHSLAIALDIGLTDANRRTADLPLYTLLNKSTGDVTSTTDPGLALSTGKWKDIGRFKGPVLRGLAARAPYFHNGSARDLSAVLDFYQQRFGVDFTRRERADLIAFLRSL